MTVARGMHACMITHNRVAQLCRTLRRMLVVADGARIIVVDNGSDDGTARTVRAELPTVNLLALPDNAGAIGRNHAVELVTTPYVAFCDDDTTWQPGSLQRGVALLAAHAELATVTGLCLVEAALTEDPSTPEMRHSPGPRPAWLPGPALLGIMAGLTMIRVTAFRAVGGFCERY